MKNLIIVIVLLLFNISFLRSEDSFNIGNIVVTATRTEHKTNEVPGTIQVISHKKINLKNTDEISDVLNEISSANILNYGAKGSLSTIGLRGLTGVHTLIMIDSIPINPPDLGSVDLSSIDPENIEQIEVVKGPYSSLYGENAVGGTINFITKKLNNKKYSEIQIEGESSEFSKLVFTNRDHSKNTNYYFNMNFNDIDGKGDNSFYKNSAFKFKMDHKINKNDNIIVNADISNKKKGYPGPKPIENKLLRNISQLQLGNDEVSNTKDYGKEKRKFISIEKKWLNWDLKTFLIKNEKEIHQWFAFKNSSNSISETENIYEHTPETKGFDLQYNTFFSNKDIFTTGLSIIRNDYKYDTLTTEFSSNKVNRSLFFQDEYHYNNKLTYFAGLRYDDPQGYSNQISPKISAVFQKNKNTSIKFSAGKAYRTPTLSDLHWPSTLTAQGNDDLDTERSYSYELNIEKKLSEKSTINASIYYQNTKNMIKWAPNGPLSTFGTPKWQPSNIGKVKTIGLELSSNIKFSKHFNSSIAFSLLNSKQKNEELINSITYKMEEKERMNSFTPKNKFNIDLNYNTLNGINILLNCEYSSAMYNYYSDWANANYTTGKLPTTEKRISPYTIFNLNIKKKYKNGELFTEINNLFNKKYSKAFGNDLNDLNYTAEGITIRTGYKFKF